ncbi:RNA polymerase sigma-70 factor, ECF subfamily [Sphingomonas gellani]|uniref:RNA polymerase sigma-70 factor, ECF subfamily n=1 Tax=Sphingomonas gellani TaxID=1166340 RepID=A0A1H8B202_9SPHN|nr:RNA polymerase sigma factor [Sphingomonas gellani]SEM76309.1 RNA polymerase sigma-70 factor, ECF subfamily [Sphingomonas gellani]
MTQGGLRAIFLAERTQFRRLLIARTGSADEAEEVLQELWLKLDHAAGPVAEPVGYLFRMAANLATDRRRSATRREAREADWAGAQPDAQAHPGMERAMLARERLAEVESALTTMPPRVSTAFRLYRFEELPQKQVAERMGISVSRVEQLLHDAYRRLHLAATGGGDPRPPRRLSKKEDGRDVG